MIALLVLLTFAVALVIDHIINRQPIPIHDGETAPAPQPRPRLIPSIVAGFRVPDNLRYHPGHTWAVEETPEMVRIGIDDLAAKLTAKTDKVQLPQRGQWIRQGQKVITMQRDGREVGLVSPIEGTVVDVNDAVTRKPELAHDDPYGEGWLIRVNAPDAKTNFRNLLGGNIARRWMDEAAARLRTLTTAPAAAFAQDGGMVLDNLLEHLPAEKIEQIEGELFLTA
jgi:glycine cleavage system H lipoate-binding protein